MEEKFINLQNDNSKTKNLRIFVNKFKNRMLKNSADSRILGTNSPESLTFRKSFNLTKLQNSHISPKHLFSKPNTSHYVRNKFFPSLDNQNQSSQSFTKSINQLGNSLNYNGNSSINRYKNEISLQAFSPSKRFSLEFADVGPYQKTLKDLLSKEYDEKIKDNIENNDQQLFNQNQIDRFIKVKQLSEYLIKEIEGLLGPTPLIGKPAFVLDSLKLLNTDYNKIFGNYFNFFEATPIILKEKPEKKEKREKKIDLLDVFYTIFYKLERIYPKSHDQAPVMKELLDDLNHELNQIKLSLRIEDYDERAYGFIVILESYIKTLYDSLEAHRIEIENLKNQISSYESFHNENYCLHSKSNTEEMLNKVLFSDTSSARKEIIKERMENLNIMNERIIELEEKLSNKHEELIKKDTQIELLEAKIHDLTAIINFKPAKSNKQTQATIYFYQPHHQSGLNDSTKIVEKLMDTSNVGFKMGYDCSLALINLILNDKMIQDYYEIKERINPQGLQAFVYQWFLTKLGNTKLTNQFITDFFSSILLEKQQRFRIFISLAGIEGVEISQKTNNAKLSKGQTQIITPIKQTLKMSTASLVENQSVVLSPQNLFMRSPQACKLLIKAMYLIKFSNKKQIDKYSPLFPMLDSELNSCSFEIVLSAFRQIMKDEEYPEEVIEECYNQLFNNFLNNNETNLRKGNLSPGLFDKIKSNLMEKTSINIDYFLIFLLDFFAQRFKMKIEGIVKALELTLINRYQSETFLIDEFRNVMIRHHPKKPKTWYDRFFATYCIKNLWVSSGTLQDMLLNVSLEFLQVDKQYLIEEKIFESKQSIDLATDKAQNIKNAHKKIEKMSSFTSLKKISSKKEIENPSSFKIENYDIINDLIVLNEIYTLVSGLIIKEEIKNETLFINHQIFKKELIKLPSLKLFKNAKFYSSLLTDYERKEMIERMEKIWNLFRVIFDSLQS